MIPPRSAWLFVACALFATTRHPAAQAARPLEVFAAYTYVKDSTVDLTFPVGWSVGGAKGLSRWLSIAAAYDASRKKVPTVAGDITLGVRTLMAGGQASARLGRATEFGQLLFGIAHASGSAFGISETSTHASLQAGAGVDYPISRTLAVRVELDYRIFFGHTSELGRQLRALSGVVFTGF